MFSQETYKYAFKYYELHNELTSKERITNIILIFGISRASFFRNYKNCDDQYSSKKTTYKKK
jgi:hypothetical protein